MSTNLQAQQSSTSQFSQFFWCNACEHTPFTEKRSLHEHMDQDHPSEAELLKGFEEEFRILASEEYNDQRKLQEQLLLAQSSSSQSQSQSNSEVQASPPTTTSTQDNTPNCFFCPATICPQQTRATRIGVIARHIDNYHPNDRAALYPLVSNQKPYKCPGCASRFHNRSERKIHITQLHGQDRTQMELLLEKHFRPLSPP